MWMIQMKTNPAPRAGRMGARQIYDALRDQILARVYGIDGLLPSSRALAGEMGVARSTVTVAYEQLAAEGFIETRHGARPRVARAIVERGRTRVASARKVRLSAFGERLLRDPPRWTEPPRGLVANFRYGELAPSDVPVLAWKKVVTAAMARKPERLAYDDPCGALRLRIALQGYLWRRSDAGTNCSPGRARTTLT
jgi:GntR family transcriptional regulator / MocR family aminotransferase